MKKKPNFHFIFNLVLSIPNLMGFIVVVHWKLSLHMCKEMLFLSMKFPFILKKTLQESLERLHTGHFWGLAEFVDSDGKSTLVTV